MRINKNRKNGEVSYKMEYQKIQLLINLVKTNLAGGSRKETGGLKPYDTMGKDE